MGEPTTKIGDSAKRSEDRCFLTGQGRYTDDINMAGQTYACFVRSRHAHARINSIDTSMARDAAELVDVDYEMLDAVSSPAQALESGRPLVHDDVPDNRCYVWEIGDSGPVDEAFDRAAHVTRLDLVNNRLIPNALEPRAALANYSRGEDHYTLYTTSQNPHLARLVLSAFVLNLPEHKVRVVLPDVGGGFG